MTQTHLAMALVALTFVPANLAAASLNITGDPKLQKDATESGHIEFVEKHGRSALQHIANSIGAEMTHPIEMFVHTPEAYAKQFGEAASRSWWAHYYRGKVHVNAGVPLRSSFVGLLYHEMSHAVVDAAGRYHLPSWFNEGLAEYFSYKIKGRLGVDDVQRLYLKDAARDGSLTPLLKARSNLSATTYLACYAAIFNLFETHGAAKVFEFVRVYATEGNFDRTFDRFFGVSPDSYADDFVDWVKNFKG
jgi:hypothetical protein